MSTPSPGSPSPDSSASSSSSSRIERHFFGKIGAWADRHLLITMTLVFSAIMAVGYGFTEYRNNQRSRDICASRIEARDATRDALRQVGYAVPQPGIRDAILHIAQDLPPINCP